MDKKINKVRESDIAAEIVDINVKDFINMNYLPYAYYVLLDRALIEAAEGLKPVQRRILYTMYEEGLTPGKLRKTQSLAGQVLAYHPHGDSSVSGAIPGLAQDFNSRVPLIDYKGSVGFVTGDKPAAPRYYEVGLSKAGYECVRDLEFHASPMNPNYDETKLEPTILPTRFPLSLILGSQGIGVGYASTMYPHNPDEVMEACVARLNNKSMTIDELMQIMKGPDFPTGGTLLKGDGVKEYFETGRGSFKVRGVYEIEPATRGRHTITFTELPYEVSAEKVITDINKAKEKGKLSDISEAKDLTDSDSGLRLVIYVKAGGNPQLMAQELFKETSVERSFSTNATVIKDNKPQLVSVLDLIDAFLEFRKSIFVNKSNNRLDQLKDEIERLEGLIKITINIDKAIKIIRNSDNAKVAEKELMKTFDINSRQANYVLSMTLRKLTKSDKIELEKQLSDSNKEQEAIKKILKSEKLINKEIIKELEATKAIISDDRRTFLSTESEEDIEEQIKQSKAIEKAIAKNSNVYIATTKDREVYRTLDKKDLDKIDYISIMEVGAKENLVVLSSDGYAEPIEQKILGINTLSKVSTQSVPNDSFIGLAKEKNSKDDIGLFYATDKGRMNIIKGGYRKSYAQAVNLDDNENIIYSFFADKDIHSNTDIFFTTEDGMALRTDIKSIRGSMAGAQPLNGMNTNVNIVSVHKVEDSDIIITITNNNITTTKAEEFRTAGRTGKGVKLINLKKDDFVVDNIVGPTSIRLLNKSNKEVKHPRASARGSTGVKLADNIVDYRMS